MSFKQYYRIAKPGMVYGNVIPVIGAFVLAAQGNVSPWLFAATVVGISLVMASSCVMNNVIDADIDAKMTRTKDRALVLGSITRRAAFAYGTVLGLAGFALLALNVNLVATVAAAVGYVFYVGMYSMWWKRRSPLGTVVGSVAGAVPPVVGYVAVSGAVDAAALVLFAVMVCWQMPHFFAIAIRRKDEYAAAGIPVLPVVRGVRATKVQMFLYAAAFAALAPLLALTNDGLGIGYVVVSLALGLQWLRLCLKGFRIPEGDPANVAWARQVFLFSLVVMVGLFLAMTADALIP